MSNLIGSPWNGTRQVLLALLAVASGCFQAAAVGRPILDGEQAVGADDARARNLAVLRALRAELGKSDKTPDASELRQLGSAFGKAGDDKAAREVLAQAVEAAKKEKQWVETRENSTQAGPSPALTLCQIALEQARVGDKAAAIATLRAASEAIDGDQTSPLDTLHSIGAQQAALGDWEGARASYRRGIALVDEDRAFSRQFRDRLAGLRAATGDLDGAIGMIVDLPGELHDRMRQHRVGKMIGAIAEVVSEGGFEPERARAALVKLQAEIGTVVRAEDKTFALGAITDAFAKIGEFQMAIDNAMQVGEGATEVDYDLRDAQPYHLSVIAYRQFEQGKLDEARKTLELAYGVIVNTPDMRGASGRLSQVAGQQIRVGDLEGARRCVERMDQGDRHGTLIRIALRERANGNAEQAARDFAAALEDARSKLEHPEPRRDVPASPFEPKAGSPEAIAQWREFRLMEIAGIEAMARGTDVALRSARSIEDEGRRGLAMARIASSLVESGQADEALRFAKSLDDPKERARALEGIGDGFRMMPYARETR
jgi:tetratricopeptide (TPR) repeat protein